MSYRIELQRWPSHFAPRNVSQIANSATVSTMTAASRAVADAAVSRETVAVGRRQPREPRRKKKASFEATWSSQSGQLIPTVIPAGDVRV